jgi:hypothetical protein
MTSTKKEMHPLSCRCTPCLTGVSIPLDWASNRQIDDLCAGRMIDRIEMSEQDFDLWLASYDSGGLLDEV